MEAIFSKSNEKVKLIKSLNEKKFRQDNNAFYLEGIKVVEEILENMEAIDILFIALSKPILTSLNGGKELLLKLEKLEEKIKILDIEEEIFKDIVETVTPQGILIVVSIPNLSIEDTLKKNKNKDKNIIILDRVQDPGNIGTIIRTCDAFNVSTIYCIKGTGDPFSPKVVRSTMGAILRVNIKFIDNVEELMFILKEKDYNIITTSLKAKNNIADISFKDKYAFVVGNESNGVSEEIQKKSDLLVKIPMEKTAESLNVGIATGILLYEQYKNKNI